MRRKIIEWALKDLFVALIAIAYYLLLYLLNTTCLIKFITGKECPCCGMTRAMICLLKGDWGGYAAYNFLTLPVFIAVYFGFHIKKKPLFFNVVLISVAVIAGLRYIFIIF